MFKPRSDGARSAPSDIVHDCDGAFDVLRSRLISVVEGRSSYAELRGPVRQLCALAHHEDLKAEELLVRFKEIWAELPSLSGLPRGRQRNELMARVATMCIEEFYGTAEKHDPRTT